MALREQLVSRWRGAKSAGNARANVSLKTWLLSSGPDASVSHCGQPPLIVSRCSLQSRPSLFLERERHCRDIACTVHGASSGQRRIRRSQRAPPAGGRATPSYQKKNYNNNFFLVIIYNFYISYNLEPQQGPFVWSTKQKLIQKTKLINLSKMQIPLVDFVRGYMHPACPPHTHIITSADHGGSNADG